MSREHIGGEGCPIGCPCACHDPAIEDPGPHHLMCAWADPHYCDEGFAGDDPGDDR